MEVFNPGYFAIRKMDAELSEGLSFVFSEPGQAAEIIEIITGKTPLPFAPFPDFLGPTEISHVGISVHPDFLGHRGVDAESVQGGRVMRPGWTDYPGVFLLDMVLEIVYVEAFVAFPADPEFLSAGFLLGFYLSSVSS